MFFVFYIIQKKKLQFRFHWKATATASGFGTLTQTDGRVSNASGLFPLKSVTYSLVNTSWTHTHPSYQCVFLYTHLLHTFKTLSEPCVPQCQNNHQFLYEWPLTKAEVPNRQYKTHLDKDKDVSRLRSCFELLAVCLQMCILRTKLKARAGPSDIQQADWQD